jgi:hypothetical protein
VAPTQKFSQSSLVCAEPLKVYWLALNCGATLVKIISKRKRLECGAMKGEKKDMCPLRVNIRRVRQRQNKIT